MTLLDASRPLSPKLRSRGGSTLSRVLRFLTSCAGMSSTSRSENSQASASTSSSVSTSAALLDAARQANAWRSCWRVLYRVPRLRLRLGDWQTHMEPHSAIATGSTAEAYFFGLYLSARQVQASAPVVVDGDVHPVAARAVGPREAPPLAFVRLLDWLPPRCCAAFPSYNPIRRDTC